MNMFLPLQCLYLSMAHFFLLPQICPDLKPVFFAPYLVANFYRLSKEKVLLRALLLGIFCDTASSCLFGIQTFLYVITSALLYKTHRIFLKDKWLSLPIITIFFSIIFVYLSYPTLAFFNYTMTWSLSSLVSDTKYAVIVGFIYSIITYVLPWMITRSALKILALLRKLLCY
ncbi:rod shape-determining protein MreD [Chlamydia gallinacea]|uniref:Rod shape-determining protein MreD n=3 Tax=Chlamydia gallinacea TaxID=1457153 RepID=A0A173DZW0_9CHLA|nr:rod shape-determining protein MreD [Chlamydia gallinacea 08-1274/3]MBX6679799.1 rod shape-determining protein MreD [Chlamydia gallinacea]MBX6687602.1 rod shape-determining protein MreD [Chlamydia gallinacea]